MKHAIFISIVIGILFMACDSDDKISTLSVSNNTNIGIEEGGDLPEEVVEDVSQKDPIVMDVSFDFLKKLENGEWKISIKEPSLKKYKINTFAMIVELLPSEILDRITEVYISNIESSFSFEGIEALQSLDYLQVIKFDFLPEDIVFIQKLTNLKTLRVNNSAYETGLLIDFSSFTSLEKLYLDLVDDLDIFSSLPETVWALSFHWDSTVISQEQYDEFANSFDRPIELMTSPWPLLQNEEPINWEGSDW